MGLEEYWLEMDPEGEPMPAEFTVLSVAKYLALSPREVRALPVEDVENAFLMIEIEGLLARRRAQDFERQAARR